MTRGRANALRVLAEIPDRRDEITPSDAEAFQPITETDIAEADREAALAEREISRDFPLLHAQALVASWSALEHLVADFLRDWLMNRPRALQAPEISKLRVTLGDYIGRSDVEQAELIIIKLQEELAAPRRRGTERFESLLRIFGLAGAVDETTAKDIFELQQVRNLIVHRSSIVDRRFLDGCPWYDLRIGDELLVDYSQFKRFHEAVDHYVLELIQRLRDVFGLGRVPAENLLTTGTGLETYQQNA